MLVFGTRLNCRSLTYNLSTTFGTAENISKMRPDDMGIFWLCVNFGNIYILICKINITLKGIMGPFMICFSHLQIPLEQWWYLLNKWQQFGDNIDKVNKSFLLEKLSKIKRIPWYQIKLMSIIFTNLKIGNGNHNIQKLRLLQIENFYHWISQ